MTFQQFNEAGGPAYPVPRDAESNGVSVRDYFAAAALTGYLAAHSGNDGDGEPLNVPGSEDAAKSAYRYADAMLKRRSEV